MNTTPTECLIKCMEHFGECEPKKVLVIYLDEDGYVRHRSSGPMYDHERIGLIEMIKQHLLDRMTSEK